MKKVDFKKALKQVCGHLAKEVVAVDAPAIQLLMIDGQGDPGNSPEFTQAVAALDRVRFESLEEGTGAQTLHVGPFSEEGLTIEKVHRFIEDSRRRLSGKHHEIYLSDMRRTSPERLRTIIRQPYA